MMYGSRIRILVFGLARSGQAAIRLLLSKGVNVRGADDNPGVRLSGDISDVEVIAGGLPSEILKEIGELVISPGVPENHPVIKEAQGLNIPVISELELAFRYCEAPVIAVTGTNGKSTTVSMIGEILKEDGRKVIVAGNTGIPFSSVATELGPEGFYVIEVSSFQLEAIREFHPVSAGILNLTPDHLDRYSSRDAYYRVKERIIENCNDDDLYFYNADDSECVRIAGDFKGRLVPFSSKRVVEDGVFLEGRHLKRVIAGNIEEVFLDRGELGVIGLHNLENALAAVAALQGSDVSAEACRRGLMGFRGLEHRMEKVAEVKGVTYYNDSKATNVEAAVKSLEGLEAPVILIAGGYDKGSDYSLFREVMENIRMVVTIGAAATLIEKALDGFVEIARAGSMKEAIRIASLFAVRGDMVVLSPACSSFDMFRDFEHRGQVFRECVHELEESTGE